MGKFFKTARTQELTRYNAPGDEDWMDFRAEFSKEEANAILSEAPTGERDLRGGFNFFEHFLSFALVAWSFTDDEGSPVAATVANYKSLEASAGRWVDEQIAAHLNLTLGAKVEELEGKSNDSVESPPLGKRSSSKTS
jgi:hypothetical protein